ncbi:MAG: Imm1 family immunity protein [Nannocystaceae bacterium]
MITIHGERRRGPPGDDAASLIARHDALDASFWIDRGEILIVNHVCTGAEGFFCHWQGGPGGACVAAIARAPRHGLALTFDGGGNWMVIDRGCVIDRDAAIAVVDHFLRTGGRSDAVGWGPGIVRLRAADEEGWVITEIGEPSGPQGRLPGGYRAGIDGPIDPSLPETATWRVLAELVVMDTEWLALLAARPMTALRRLEVWDAKALSGLAEAVAALPSLESLLVFGPAVVELPRLSSPSLRRITLALADAYADPEEPEGWREQVAARLRACDLPGLETAELLRTVETSEP